MYLIDDIENGINLVKAILSGIISFMDSVIDAYNYLSVGVFSSNPYMTAIMAIILFGVLGKSAVILWNVVADANIAGFKLPKIPL